MIVGLVILAALFVAWVFEKVFGNSIQTGRDTRIQDAAFERTVEFFEKEMPIWSRSVDLWLQHWVISGENLGRQYFEIQARQELGIE